MALGPVLFFRMPLLSAALSCYALCGNLIMVYAYQTSPSILQHARLCETRAFVYQHSDCRRCKPRTARGIKAFTVRAGSEKDQPDLIERIFGRVFGSKALEERSPGGMKRMSEEAMLEQHPATLTEFAAPVNSDDKTMAVFRPLLAQTRLQKLPLRCAREVQIL